MQMQLVYTWSTDLVGRHSSDCWEMQSTRQRRQSYNKMLHEMKARPRLQISGATL